ncbi:bifunctional 3'-5' exonuclease/DNA polymerase [Eubacteriales bacterium OttesenSCG-928-A19]|nr:bifunctional 3'-5' exonuclease/DNA polymerase [Eubacteriales bacterium OttesenSCG-928-A19]
MLYCCVTSLADLQAYLEGATVVAFDFETSPDDPYREEEKAALDAHRSHIVGISFSVAPESAIYVPLAHRLGINAANPDEIWAWLQPVIFESPAVIKIAHNLSFEAMFLYARGIVLQLPCYDTIAAAQLTLKSNYAFRGLSDSGLKTLVPALLDMALPSFAEVTEGRCFDELDAQDDETVRYACADSDYALRLYEMFNGWFDRYLPKHRLVVEQVESPTAIYVGIMKHNGLLVDTQRMQEKQAEAEAQLQRIREDIAFIIGDISIGANASTSAFKRYLYDDLQLPVMKTTAKHQEAMDDEALILLGEWCAENRPELAKLFSLVQEYRRWGKITSTYITGYLAHVNAVTGRIHPDLLPLATETGRFAARNPNLQNMPRAGNDDVGVRSFFIAPEGCTLLSLDFSQIELRVGAFYCRDERMLATYRDGGDIHAATTSVIYGIPLAQAMDKHADDYKERRTIAKNVNFGTFYGLYPRGLHRTLKFKAGVQTSLPECERIIGNLKRGYPGLLRWQEKAKQRAGFRHYTETWLGRRRYLPGIASPDWGKKTFAERCALNTPIQGTAADILKLALARIIVGLPSRPWLKPLLQIHDELVFEIPTDKLTEAVRFIKDCMEQRPFDDFDVPIVAEAAYGDRFGELHELD